MHPKDRTNLGDITDLEAVAQLVPVDGLQLVDVGCGAGDTPRGLAGLGATVLGVEPDPVQAAKNEAAEPTANVMLLQAGAEAIPAEDNSADGVFFFRSLHHVPHALMPAAMAEAARVLKPDGFLFVLEPAMYGSHFHMMKPFHDETIVRTQAQEVLEGTANDLFETCEKVVFMQRPRHESLDAAVAFYSGMSFNNISPDMVDVPEVRSAFDAAKTDDGYHFEQPNWVNVYRGMRG
jgi:SAM-dependent methyltransferase